MMMQKSAKKIPPQTGQSSSVSVSAPRLSKYTILGNRICYGLTALPTFADELPDLISTLEAGEPVATSRIQDRFKRKVIENILAELPLVQEQGVWRKDQTKLSISIRKFIYQALLHAGQVIQPTDLSPAQTKAARFPAIKFSKMLRDHPEIVSELGPVLDLLLVGGNLQLDGMENASVQTHLEEFLESIGVQNDEDGSGFHVSGGVGGNQMSSSSSSSSRQSQEQLQILQYFRNIIHIYSDSAGEYAEVSGKANNIATSKGTDVGDGDNDSMDTDQSSSSSTSSSSFASDDSSSDESSVLEDVGFEVDERNNKFSRDTVVMFPVRPANLKELAKAKNMSASYHASNENDSDDNSDDDDDDDDDSEVIGPALSSKIHPRTLLMESEPQKSLSLQEEDDIHHLFNRGGEGGGKGENMTIADESEEIKRDEWMMVPGASDGIFVGGASARQFNSGSNARKLAKDYAAQMEVRRKQLEESDEFKRKQEENEQLNAKRGPSLMQLHQNPENKSKKMKTSDSSSRSGGSGGGRQRFGGEDGDGDGFSFDYEKEMGVNRKMTPKEVQQFLENAEKNKSKFVRGLF